MHAFIIYKRAFTLIEAIIYLALFSIVIGGALMSAAALFEGAGSDTAKARLQEEGAFMLEKAALTKTIPDAGYLQGLTDSSIVVSNVDVATSISSSLGTPIHTTGIRFTLTTHTRQGRSIRKDFFATSAL